MDAAPPLPKSWIYMLRMQEPADSLLYRSRNMYALLVKVISRRTGIPEETIKRELYCNPFVFHTFIFSKLKRTKAKGSNNLSQKREISISPTTRIEGHGKVTIVLNEDGNVADAYFYATEIRGFDYFLRGMESERLPFMCWLPLKP